MKYFFLVIILISVNAAQRSDRCNNCGKPKDPMPSLMAQTFFNVIINGFIATQSQHHKEQQNAAVINALQSISHFVQTALKKFDPKKAIKIEELVSELERYQEDPEFIEFLQEQLVLKRNQLLLLLKSAS